MGEAVEAKDCPYCRSTDREMCTCCPSCPCCTAEVCRTGTWRAPGVAQQIATFVRCPCEERAQRPERPPGYWERIDAIVAQAPPLNDEQRTIIRAAFRRPREE